MGSFGLLEKLFLNYFFVSVFFILGGLSFRGFVFVFLNNFFFGEDFEVFFFSISFGMSESSIVSLDVCFVEFGINVLVCGVKNFGDVGELRVYNLRRSVLEMLNGVSFVFSRVGRGVSVGSFGGGEDIGIEIKDIGGMVYVDGEIVFFVVVYDEFFNCGVGNLERFGELS